MRRWIPLALILLAYLGVGALFATYTPDWEAPDEPAHYNYVRQLAAGQLPVIEPGDYDQEYIFEVVFESHFAPPRSIEPLEYEDWQPPLYYLLLTPVYWLSSGSLHALRLFSLLLGAGVVALAYGIVLKLFPERRWVAATTSVFVAFLPQHVAIMASVNNDSLAELLIAAILLLLVSWPREAGKSAEDEPLFPLRLGLLLGLGFLTKGTVYLMAPVMGTVLLHHHWGEWRKLLRAAVLVFGPALFLGSLWWARNISVYGGLDVLGKAAHDAVVTGQPRTAELVAKYGLAESARQFTNTTFNSFWGQFGWMTVPMPGWVYRPLWFFSGAIVIGLAIIRGRRRPGNNPSPHVLLIMGTLLLLTVGLLVGYNFTFQQHQGRYLFPALIPMGIAVAMGLEGWLRLFSLPDRIASYALATAMAMLLIGLDLYALFGMIVPALG